MSRNLFLLLAQRTWQSVSGLVTLIFIAHFMSPQAQGWYYSFLSLASIYTLFDLGLAVVLVQLSAHRFTGLRWTRHGDVEGEGAAGFRSLAGRSARAYAVLAVVFALLMLPAGLVFFGYRPQTDAIHWVAPWCALVLMTAAWILILPFLALIEGSGGIAEVYGLRLAQGVLGSIGCWIAVISGANVWAALMVPTMGVLVGGVWFLVKRPRMLAMTREAKHDVSWRHEVWPLQWRVGISFLSAFLLTQIYTPILFRSQGAAVAGQMGLSLAIVNMLVLLGQSWVARHVPALARAAAQRDWHTMDTLFNRDFMVSTLAIGAGAVTLCGLHLLLQDTAYGSRILPFWPFVGLLGTVLIGHMTGVLAIQLRAYKREPLVWVYASSALLTVSLALWNAPRHGAGGIVASMLAVQLLFALPISVWIWKQCNLTLRAV